MAAPSIAVIASDLQQVETLREYGRRVRPVKASRRERVARVFGGRR